jgi:hypothetical protein
MSQRSLKSRTLRFRKQACNRLQLVSDKSITGSSELVQSLATIRECEKECAGKDSPPKGERPGHHWYREYKSELEIPPDQINDVAV